MFKDIFVSHTDGYLSVCVRLGDKCTSVPHSEEPRQSNRVEYLKGQIDALIDHIKHSDKQMEILRSRLNELTVDDMKKNPEMI